MKAAARQWQGWNKPWMTSTLSSSDILDFSQTSQVDRFLSSIENAVESLPVRCVLLQMSCPHAYQSACKISSEGRFHRSRYFSGPHIQAWESQEQETVKCAESGQKMLIEDECMGYSFLLPEILKCCACRWKKLGKNVLAVFRECVRHTGSHWDVS